MRILIAEDEEELARGLKFLLEKNKYAVDIAGDGRDALEMIRANDYDGVVLDIMMPYVDGLEVLRTVRAEHRTVPVMMLTAKGEIEDRVTGLEAGADDYLPKPFATREFIARVGALVRRRAEYTGSVMAVGNVRLDCSRYEISCGNSVLRLNNKEFQITELFFRNPHVVFSAEHLMDRIWGPDSGAGIDVVWTYIGYVRKRLKSVGADVEIRTVRGAGYALEPVDGKRED